MTQSIISELLDNGRKSETLDSSKALQCVEAVCEFICRRIDEKDNIHGSLHYLTHIKEQLLNDVMDFLTSDEELLERLKDGCGVYFGIIKGEVIKSQRYAWYHLALKDSVPGSTFPVTIIVSIYGVYNLAGCISSILKIHNIDPKLVCELIKAEENGHIKLRVLTTIDFVNRAINDEDKIIKISSINKKFNFSVQVDVPVCAFIDGNEVLLCRADWYSSIPECYDVPSVYDFDVLKVRN